MIPALPSRRALCATQHRFWPIKQKPGESMCLRCGCTEFLPRIKAWPLFRRPLPKVLTFVVAPSVK